MEKYDALILGAGAAGLFCAGSALAQASAKGMRIGVIDHATQPGEKIRISGGGRCNFTNLATERTRFLSQNPRFCASALAGFGPRDFVALVDRAGIAWHEKTAGQLFCDGRATQITDMLLRRAQGADLMLETSIELVSARADGYRLRTSRGVIDTHRLVIATGGKSIPKMGATGLAYKLATQFDLRVTETHPGLVPLAFAEQDLTLCKPLAGIALPVRIRHGKTVFDDDLLFTHRGLSGPAILQISSYWRPGDTLEIDLAPGRDIAAQLRARKREGGRIALTSALAAHLPKRLAEAITAEQTRRDAKLADQSDKALAAIGARVNRWQIKPVGSEGYRTAEVTLGGIDTRDLDAATLRARARPDLYVIGEAVDVTGWLGGYNFQWAWASAHAAGLDLARSPR